ncbi:MAG TPA: hypothetical protein VGU20_00080 [Stellaceae bacterium]|nr:hypothetical protein [Stellaceae bacterium]
MKPAYAALAIALLLFALAACSRVPTERAPSSLSAADQDYIASRHGGM